MLAAPFLAAALAVRAEARPDMRILIGIAHKVASLVLKPDGRFALIDSSDGARGFLANHQSYRLEVVRAGLRLGSLALSGEARLKPEKPTDTILIGKRRYQGDLILKRNEDGTVTVVDELGIEDYLLGVLPNEMDAAWPIESLKAQAVVARTFAYSHLGKFKKSGFDLTPDTRSQMYLGIGEAPPSVKTAVEKTRGEVLGYKGALLDVYYHASCGGHTTDPASVWGDTIKPPKPLQGVRDRTCAASPHNGWSVFFPDEDLLAALRPGTLDSGPLKSIKVASRGSGGYATSFKARIDRDDVIVGANAFRSRLGSSDLKSVLITKIVKRKGGFEFYGAGSGHGVGLCQWGARLQAQSGKRYEKILKFYFPGSTLSVVDQ